MRAIRLLLCWVFAFIAAICALIAGTYLWALLRFAEHPTEPLSASLILSGLIVPAVFSAMAFTFGRAWWTILRETPSARRWGIAASLLHTAAMLFAVVADKWIPHRHAHHVPLSHVGLFLAIGVIGVVVFSLRYKRPDLSKKLQQTASILGDGTSKFVNRLSGLVFFVVVDAAIVWRQHWNHARGIPTYQRGFLEDLLFITLIVLALTGLHELGHTSAGLALGMKLRAFFVGPFQWSVRDGRWEFHFDLKKILSGGGATGVVPTTAEFSTGGYLFMLAAGPLANMCAGVAALWIASSAGGISSVQARGELSLFGAFSLAVAICNLIPVRTKSNYTDGAKIYQILSGGPWGDFHRTILFVGSSTVTVLRPRDFSLQAMQRAAAGITQGFDGLVLRLFIHECYLDRKLMNEAGWALKEAETIFHESASEIPVELHTPFVFGNAYVLHDAVAAREWWGRMEAKKPTRFNVDYWRAKSALCWVEGDLQGADVAWAKCEAAAQKLPHAGAYEFDRYLCDLLRNAIDASVPQAAELATA